MRLLVLVSVLLFAVTTQAQAPACNKPYRLGHFVQLGNEDLRVDRTRRISKKELKESNKKQEQAQAARNALVSEHPNIAVSKEFSYTVRGFLAVRERCDSFCGTLEELMQLYDKEYKEIGKQ
jgi:hypothetical protein